MDFSGLVSVISTLSVLVLIACLAGLVVLMVPAGERARTSVEPDLGGMALTLRRRAVGLREPGLKAIGLLQRRLSLNTGLVVVAVAAAFLGGLLVGRATAGSPPVVSGPGVRTTTVQADKGWQDAGPQIAAGQKLTISVRGEWTHQKGMVGNYGPRGSGKNDDKAILPTAPVGTLLARVGSSSPFAVGESTTITANSSGPLQLVMNDWPDGHGDNLGSMTVTVTIAEQ